MSRVWPSSLTRFFGPSAFAPFSLAPLFVAGATVLPLASCATLFGDSQAQSACENAKDDVHARFGDVTIYDCQLLADDAGDKSVWVEIEVNEPRDTSFANPVSDQGLRRGRQVLEDILTGKAPPASAAEEAARLRADAAVCPEGRCAEADVLAELGTLSGVDPLGPVKDEGARAVAIGRFLFRNSKPLEAAGRLAKVATLDSPPPHARPLFARSLAALGDVDTAIDLLAADAASHKEITRDLLDDLLFIGILAQETPYLVGRRLNLAIAAWERYLELVPQSPQRKTVDEGMPILRARLAAEAVDIGTVEPVRVVLEVPQGDEVGAAKPDAGAETPKKAERFVPLISGETYEVRGRGEIQFVRFFAEWRGYGPAALVQERADGDVRHRLIFALTPAVERMMPRAIPLAMRPRFVAKIR